MICPRLGLLVAVLTSPALAQGIDETIARWSSLDWDERETASREVVEAWRRWTDADLARLETTAREYGDPEVRQRASRALGRIETRRILGESLVGLGLDRSFDRDRPESVWVALGEALDAWWVGRAGGEALAGLVDFAVLRGWEPAARELLERGAREALVPCLPLFSAFLGDAGARRGAIAALRKLGPLARASRIAPLLRDPEVSVQVEALRALGELGGPEELESILPFLRSADGDLREAAEGAARAIDPGRFSAPSPGLTALPDSAVLVERLGDADPAVRRAAVARLGLAGARDRAGAVIERLSDPAAEVRIAASLALAALDAREARPAIRALLEDPDPHARSIAVLALGRLGDTEILRQLLAAEVPRARRDAALVVASLHMDELYPMAATVLPDGLYSFSYVFRSGYRFLGEVVPLARDPDPRLRAWAAESLGDLGAVDEAELVATLLADPDQRVRLGALGAIAQIGRPGHAKTIAPLLDDPEAPVRARALAAFDALAGPEANEYLAGRLRESAARGENPALAILGGRGLLEPAVLLPLLRAEDASTRARAVSWLAGTGGRASLPAIAELRFDPDPFVREACLRAVGGLGSAEDVPIVLPILRAGSPDSRCASISALKWIGHGADAIAPLVDDPDPTVRAEAIHALSWMGRAERYEAIAARFGDRDARVREAAGSAMWRLPGDGGDVAAARWLDSDDPEIRAAAVLALGKRGARRYAGRIAAGLDGEGPVLRASIEALGELGATEYAGRIAPHLDADDPEVAAAAAEALGVMGARGHAPAVERLLERRDRSWETPFELEWLGAEDWGGFQIVEGQSAIEALRTQVLAARDPLFHPPPSLRLAAARALARLGAREYVPRIAALQRETGGLAGELASLGSAEFEHGAFFNAYEAVRLETPECLAPLARSASHGGPWQELAILALAEAVARIVPPPERAPWIRAIEEAARSPRLELARYGKLALVQLGVLDRAEVRRLVREISGLPRTNRFILSLFLVDALEGYLDPEAHLLYVRDRDTSFRIEDHEGVRRFFAEAGLELSAPVGLRGPSPVNPGVRTSPRALLEPWTIDAVGLLEGRAVRLVSEEEALRALMARLEE